ncbi:hypothetical protein BSCG_02491 [Bacteroides sp. 2_2_4]|nr:hypothetical protein BSCG_02491 [Bacteroides sp. 2_2_4]
MFLFTDSYRLLLMFTEFIFLIFSLLYGENIVFIFVSETMLLGSFRGCHELE